LTPAVVHYGLADGVRDQRQRVLAAAYAAHPERFVRGVPQPAALPEAVWINPPQKNGLVAENTGRQDALARIIHEQADVR